MPCCAIRGLLQPPAVPHNSQGQAAGTPKLDARTAGLAAPQGGVPPPGCDAFGRRQQEKLFL